MADGKTELKDAITDRLESDFRGDEGKVNFESKTEAIYNDIDNPNFTLEEFRAELKKRVEDYWRNR